jgi:hypothetical protein
VKSYNLPARFGGGIMKKKMVWALVLGVAALACVVGYRELMPEHHFIAGVRIVFAEPDSSRPKDFDSAIRHFKAIPEYSWAYEEVPEHLLAIEAQRDRPEDFQSFTPEQHYVAAVYVCQHPPLGDYDFTPFDIDCLVKSPRDFSRAIRHLEAIQQDSQMYEDAARALRLIKIERDRPQDFEAARDADSKQCLAKAYARFHGQDISGNAITNECDIFNFTRATNILIGSYKIQASASKDHWTEKEVLERVKAAAAESKH